MQIPVGSKCAVLFFCSVFLSASGPAFADRPTKDGSDEPTEAVGIDDRFSMFNRALGHCERILPVCQPAIAQRYWTSRDSLLRTVHVIHRVPVVDLDPRISRMMTALATGFVLRTARDIATDPYAIDPVRYYSPAHRNMVGLYTPAQMLDEINHPVIGYGGSSPLPRSVVDADLD